MEKNGGGDVMTANIIIIIIIMTAKFTHANHEETRNPKSSILDAQERRGGGSYLCWRLQERVSIGPSQACLFPKGRQARSILLGIHLFIYRDCDLMFVSLEGHTFLFIYPFIQKGLVCTTNLLHMK